MPQSFAYPKMQASQIKLRESMGIPIKEQPERRAILPDIETLRSQWETSRIAREAGRTSPTMSRPDFYTSTATVETLSRGGTARSDWIETLRPCSPPGHAQYRGTPLSPMTQTTSSLYERQRRRAGMRLANVPGPRFNEAPSAAHHKTACAIPLRTVDLDAWNDMRSKRGF